MPSLEKQLFNNGQFNIFIKHIKIVSETKNLILNENFKQH